ncbi:MAG: N-acetylmuramoyl-L-alanine amidase [Pelosinus sp.]|nr:N-acetylmuramoyl-L-alanine amidase [Pelosinus sp.]
MFKKKCLSACLLVILFVMMIFVPVQSVQAAGLDSIVSTLAQSTVSSEASTGGGGLVNELLDLLFNKILGPVLNIFNGKAASSSNTSSAKITPLPSGNAGSVVDSGVLRGKVIVVDPGHGGSNPGAVANNDREADNNLAVGLKLKDKLSAAGAKVILTRSTDRTVAPEGSSLGQELESRVSLAETNHADMFISIHSNENPDSSIAGAMTFYHSAKSPQLALSVQSELIKATGAVDKGTSPATYYVLRNTSMPGILVEMGFVSNAAEAGRLQNDSYQNNIAQGIYAGVVKYFNNR